jgi:hypothetical protein
LARAHFLHTNPADLTARERKRKVNKAAHTDPSESVFLHEFRKDSFPALAIAEAYMGLGDQEQTFDWLHGAIEQKD